MIQAMTTTRAWVVALLALGWFGAVASACSSARSDCPSGTGAAASSLSGHDGGTAGVESGRPPSCNPSESTSVVADICGVFVSSSKGSDTTGQGTKEAPFRTLGEALAEAMGRPVYACGERFTESVWLPESATLYGGLDCTKGWVYDASQKTQLTAAADVIPLTVSMATTNAELFDFAITSANATQPGASSIAVLVAQSAASFTRCDLTAGDGKEGAAGVPHPIAAPAGKTGLTGADACTAPGPLGGISVLTPCGNDYSVSGPGGDGQPTVGGPGGDGQPGTALNGGQGEGSMLCTSGTKGEDGDTLAPAMPGTGATGFGTLSVIGYTGVPGGAGSPGSPGQGGGGGGGAKGGAGNSECASASSEGGASGGSGGSGGCGGAGGNGGGAGGSSIALVSINATLSLRSVTLQAGTGGNGGDGGAGQPGGMGGPGGSGGKAKAMYANLNDACSGGPGGSGGTGGQGGGGLGGHSLGLAFTGKAPPKSGWTATPGIFGAGGTGDTMNDNKGDGASGQAQGCWDFDRNAACM